MPPSPRPSASAEYVAVMTPRASTASATPPAALQRVVAIDALDSKSLDHTKKKSPKKSARKQPGDVSLRDLYRYATTKELALLALGCLSAAASGALYPCMALIFGHVITAFEPFDRDAVNSAALQYFQVAIGLFVTDFASAALFAALAEGQVRTLRQRALRHLLHLDVQWYDARSNAILQLSSRITGDTLKIKDGMGQKLGDAIKFAAQFLVGYTIGFTKSWDLALVMCTMTPFMVGTMSYLLNMLRTNAQRSQQLYAEAGAVAEETLASMRTVSSLNAEQRATDRYQEKVLTVEDANVALFRRAAFYNGIYTAALWLMNAVGLWYGGYKVYHSEMAPSTKQRIAIARAIIRDPKILVLDEATSALDNESERVVQAALTQVMQDAKRTTIVIAHRLSTVRSANKIVVMMNGMVHEQGTHEELMQIPDGVYRGMYELQAKQEEEERHESDASAVENTQAKDDAVPKSSGDAKEKGAQRSLPASSAEETSSETSSEASSTSKFTLRDAMEFSSPEKPLLVTGIAGAIVQGFSFPVSALLISEVVATMTRLFAEYRQSGDDSQLAQIKSHISEYAYGYLGFAVAMGLAHATQIVCFRTMAAKLTTRLRMLHFRSLCSQDIAFFDKPAHGTGALTSDLATNALKVSLVSGDSQGRLVYAVTMFIAAIFISFLTGSWLLSFILLAIFPLVIIGEVIRTRQMRNALLHTDQLGEAGAVASQALTNVRTVMALGIEDKMCANFAATLEKPYQVGKKEAKMNGAAIGYSSFVIFATYALVFWYGGKLVHDGKISFKELLRSLMAIIMSSQGIGFALSWLGEAQHAFNAGSAILRIRDYPRSINTFDRGTDTREELTTVQGRLQFRDVTFRYPTRPEVTVLDGFNLSVEPNQTIGICGPSGGGKSTIVSLLERFYDPESGQVLLDGHDLRALKVQWLRGQIGYVGQEPTLFMGTIAENIAYGLESRSEADRPTQQDIERAARLANAHDFISNLPEGYATQVGAKGEQLSGGQKQRIAIARALLRNPKLLILDEATSALDSESERIVQQALDEVVAARARTTIVIAHRLSTIRNADKIVVVERGRVVEQGTHSELMRVPNGVYQSLLAETEKAN
ncbi:hypothetical protein ATCC90586_005409 [Pythium insidiosum]|nr:hypothetical protein ATCC90586_005409 [Pythium insidiosum]